MSSGSDGCQVCGSTTEPLSRNEKCVNVAQCDRNRKARYPAKSTTDFLLSEIGAELVRARLHHPGLQHSAHEGYAVLLEEVDGLWDEVKKKQSLRSTDKMRKEAIQVAAMALRLIEDVIDRGATC